MTVTITITLNLNQLTFDDNRLDEVRATEKVDLKDSYSWDYDLEFHSKAWAQNLYNELVLGLVVDKDNEEAEFRIEAFKGEGENIYDFGGLIIKNSDEGNITQLEKYFQNPSRKIHLTE